jgi:phosphopantothenate-cysteine ligase/phosphopantothenoylcysteine decarboxylase/phosphopantothenate--cysteine ligase
MNILVTAGNTQTPIDKVRCLTNIFSGRTGGRLAVESLRRGHVVTLLTSHPEVLPELASGLAVSPERWRIETYRTFDDLSTLMESSIRGGGFEAIIHAAAVSDYALAGIFAPGQGGTLDDVSAGKVKSHHPELWLRLTPTPKLVDRIRRPWGFSGTLVKFKLEVGLTEAGLRETAERSRVHSEADLMVANTLEGMNDWALVGPVQGGYAKVARANLPRHLLEIVEEHGRRDA